MMSKRKEEERLVARGLRMEGWSYKRIAKELNVSVSSAYNWCNDIVLTPEQTQANKERQVRRGDDNKGAKTNKARALKKRKQYQEQGRIKARFQDNLHIIGCMLYWAEGAKYMRHAIIFANSDVEMIKIFANFLRESLDVPDEKIKVKVHCHTKIDNEIEAIENYWLDVLHLPQENLQKTQVVKSSGRSKNRLEYGVCTITVQSTEHLPAHLWRNSRIWRF